MAPKHNPKNEPAPQAAPVLPAETIPTPEAPLPSEPYPAPPAVEVPSPEAVLAGRELLPSELKASLQFEKDKLAKANAKIEELRVQIVNVDTDANKRVIEAQRGAQDARNQAEAAQSTITALNAKVADLTRSLTSNATDPIKQIAPMGTDGTVLLLHENGSLSKVNSAGVATTFKLTFRG